MVKHFVILFLLEIARGTFLDGNFPDSIPWWACQISFPKGESPNFSFFSFHAERGKDPSLYACDAHTDRLPPLGDLPPTLKR